MGDGLADGEGIADGEHHIADLQRVRIRELDRREPFARILQAQHREVGSRVLQHDLGLELALVRERNLDLVGAFDDVHIGDDKSGRIHHHARAE